MNTFDEAFRRISLEHLLAKIISQKLEDQGHSLTHSQLTAIREQIANTNDDAFSTELPSDEDVDLQIDIGDEDFARVFDEYGEKLSNTIPKVVQETSSILLAQLKNTAPGMLAEHKRSRDQFEQSVLQEWGDALNLLEMLIVIASEAGEDFADEFGPSASEHNDSVFEVLVRLHARSCQIANEVLTLLKAGYADGANARWRTMHEIAVVGLFVKKFGQDVAERYLLHETIESYRAARQYQRHSDQLGYNPLTDQELLGLESSHEQLIDRFGRPYAKTYGWAAQALGNNDPKFTDIEQAVGFEHWRPHYKLASHSVHANPKGVLFQLGLYLEEEEVLLAGPSNTGFANLGHSTAISLLQIVTVSLTLHPNIDRLAICHVMLAIAEEIGNTLSSAQMGQDNHLET